MSSYLDDARADFDARTRPIAMARGAEPEAVRAAYELSLAVEWGHPRATGFLRRALDAYWRSIGIDP